MTEEFLTITEVVERLQISKGLLNDLEQEEIICPVCLKKSAEKMLSASDLERLRIAKLLIEEMDVNVPGVEVILQMRQNMLDIRRQFDEILEDLARRLQERFKE
jgi:MerR family transcriptional regulator/heat shock protein HspR